MGKFLFSIDTSDNSDAVRQMLIYISKDVSTKEWLGVKDSEISNFYLLLPEYIEDGHSYKKGDPFRYNGKYYRASQDIISSVQWKPGDLGTESLFYEIKIASNGIIIWQQPRGEFDAPDKGDLRWYPDENGFIYESLIDGNSFSPDEYPSGWELVE